MFYIVLVLDIFVFLGVFNAQFGSYSLIARGNIPYILKTFSVLIWCLFELFTNESAHPQCMFMKNLFSYIFLDSMIRNIFVLLMHKIVKKNLKKFPDIELSS
jgi:hypothetical protein